MESENLASQDLKNLFKFHSYLLDNLLALRDIRFCIVARETLTSAANRKALVIEEASDLTDNQNVLALIITTVAASLYRFQLWELLLPIPKYVRFHGT